MSNHFHLVVETPLPNLVAGMKCLLGVYTKRFNIRHQECGHLFAGRYKTLIVEGSGNGYLRTVCDYVHLNPVRAKLLKAEDPIESFRWSIGATHYGAERRETEEAKAQRLVKEEMDRIGWEEKDLLGTPKGDKRKVRMAARLRGETTMTLKWIAERLVMGGWTNVSNLLGAERAKSKPNVKSEN